MKTQANTHKKTKINIMKKTVSKMIFAALVIIFAQCRETVPDTITLTSALDLQGHRGARGLAPENTWNAFLIALDYKVTTLELDTVITKDSVQLVHHDTELNPEICTHKDGSPLAQRTPISQLKFSFLKRLDCGSKQNQNFPQQVPSPGEPLLSLPEFFEKFKQLEKTNAGLRSIKFNIEAKFANDTKATQKEMVRFADIFARNVAESGYTSRVTIQSFVIDFLPIIKERLPNISTAALFSPSRWQGFLLYLGLGDKKTLLEKARRAHANIISPYYLYVTSQFVQDAHKSGLAVIPWTVNEESEMRRQIAAGVDGIISDYPDRMRALVDEILRQQKNNE